MKKTALLTIVSVVFVFFATHGETGYGNSVKDSGAPYYTPLPDSLDRLQNVISYLISDPERALTILESYKNMEPSLRRTFYTDGQLNQIQAEYYFANGLYRESIEYNALSLEDEFIAQPHIRVLVLDQMMEAARMMQDYDSSMRYALMMLEVARELDNSSQIGRAYMFMGIAQYRIGDRSQGRSYFQTAEEYLLEGDEIYWLSLFYLTAANMFVQKDEVEEAHRYGVLYEESLDILEKEYYYQDEKFVDVHRGRAYVLMAEILFRMDRKAEAEEYYNRFKDTWNATDPREGYHIVPYLLAAEKYHEAEGYLLRTEEVTRMETDTITDRMTTIKKNLHTVYENTGRYDKSRSYIIQVQILTDSLRRREQRSSALEIAEIYMTAEREATIAAQQSEIKKRNTFIAVSSIMAGLLFILFIIITVYNGKLNRKNRILAERIRLQHQNREGSVPASVEGEQMHARKKRSEQSLFEQLETIMRTERPYLNSKLLRDEVVNMLGTNKNYLIDAIQANTGMNFPDYINSLRLEFSLDLLADTDEIISEIAARSGFGSVSSYHRLFTEKYGLSPNTYRKLGKREKISNH